jgi:hypothetical protein
MTHESEATEPSRGDERAGGTRTDRVDQVDRHRVSHQGIQNRANDRFAEAHELIRFRLPDHRGITGSGIVTSPVRTGPHVDGSDSTANFVEIEFPHLVPAEQVLGLDVLQEAVPAGNWR